LIKVSSIKSHCGPVTTPFGLGYQAAPRVKFGIGDTTAAAGDAEQRGIFDLLRACGSLNYCQTTTKQQELKKICFCEAQ
jgi:hypothetical protein